MNASKHPPRALLSVSDKRGLAELGARLHRIGFELVSTGGTYRALREAGVPVRTVTEITGQIELFDGRVKTLHPYIHGAILFRRDLPAHVEQAAAHEIRPIDLVVVNLYPFQETVARPDVTREEAIEEIDIGGPTMIRAAAKNHANVTVCVSPDEYDALAGELEANGTTSPETRARLAREAFRHTAAYDAAIASYLDDTVDDTPSLPHVLATTLIKVDDLRYGENPHQSAAIYRAPNAAPYHGARVLQGKELSYNNLIDLDAAISVSAEFDDPACTIVKHTNPCGVGRHASDIQSAYAHALDADPVSAFGGIIALNQRLDAATASLIAERFFEIVAAFGIDDDALKILGAKKSLRVVDLLGADLDEPPVLRRTRLGTLMQSPDPRVSSMHESWEIATDRAPSEDEAVALRFAWRVCKHVKSNAIVLGTHERTTGVGAGQMSRVEAVDLAIRKAGAAARGSVLASDAFFPFADGVELAAAAGIKAIIQPGGSIRDAEVVAAANAHGVAMVLTRSRHFRH